MKELFTNYIFIVPLIACVTAQISKGIIYAIKHSKFDFRRMLGTGDMPSSHSAAVTALVVAAAKKSGLGSAVTAVSLILAIIVIHDAFSIRKQTGKHAQILNQIVEEKENGDEIVKTKQLNEKTGHTFLQVVIGIALGAGIALAIPLF